MKILHYVQEVSILGLILCVVKCWNVKERPVLRSVVIGSVVLEGLFSTQNHQGMLASSCVPFQRAVMSDG